MNAEFLKTLRTGQAVRVTSKQGHNPTPESFVGHIFMEYNELKRIEVAVQLDTGPGIFMIMAHDMFYSVDQI